MPAADPDAAPVAAPMPQPRLDTKGLAIYLAVSISHVERLVMLGLPCIDVGVHQAGRRPRRAWRFDPDAVIRWLASRSGGGDAR